MSKLIFLMLLCISICSTSPDYENAKTYVDMAKEGATFLNSVGTWYKENFANKEPSKKLNVKSGLKSTLFTALSPKVTKALNAKTLGKLAKMAKGLLSIAGALGPIGALFSFASLFIPEGPSEELLAIEKGFKEVNVRFDKLELKFDNKDFNDKKRNAYNKFNEIESLYNVLDIKYKLFLDDRTSGSTKKLYADACSSHPDDPLGILSRLHDLVVGVKSQTDYEPLLDVMLEETKYNFTKVKFYFGNIMSNVVNLAKMVQVCQAISDPNGDSNLRMTAITSETMIMAIDAKFKNATDFLKTYALATQLETDMTDELNNTKEVSQTNLVLRIKKFLDAKYSWLLWNVYVFKEKTVNSFWQRTTSNSRAFLASETKAERNLVVTWAEPESYAYKKESLENARDYLDGYLQVLNCNGLDARRGPSDAWQILMFPQRHMINSITGKKVEQFEVADTSLIVNATETDFVASDNTLYYRLCHYLMALSIV